MSKIETGPSPGVSDERSSSHTRPRLRKRLLQALVLLLLAATVGVAWQVLSALSNDSRPLVVGRPLSNPHTHLHTIALGGRPGILYLGTHYGLFTSTDGGKTWPQSYGALSGFMVTSIAVSLARPTVLGVIAIPRSGLAQMGVYFSRDGGTTFTLSVPHGLSPGTYPYVLKAGPASEGNFYAFYAFGGWYETRDLGVHWYPITDSALSGMQTPSFLVDPDNANHLLLGGDQGLFESHDDGKHWNHLSAVNGDVLSIVASSTTPRLIYCGTDQGIYRWYDGSHSIVRLMNLPMAPPTRLAADSTGKDLYAISGQDLWFSEDAGISWERRFHFERGDLIAFLVDQENSNHLYTGFYLPAEVISTTDGGRSWHILTD